MWYNHQMRILLCFLSALFLSCSTCFAIQEVILETDDDLQILDKQEIVQTEVQNETTLYEKIQNIKAKEITNTNTSPYLLEEIFTHQFETGFVDTIHLFGYYRAGLNLDISEDDTDLDYSFNTISAGVNGKFKDGKTYYEARFRFNPQHNYSFLQYAPSNIYIANTSIPNHTVIAGNTRTPVGYEGGMSMTYLPFVNRSQISRNFGNTRKVGLRIKGNYSLIEYDLGGYSSDTYFREFFPGTEFSGWANIKPLGKTDGRWGNLKLGGGLTAGKNGTDYAVTGVYAGYEYKNFMANFEYAYANGYNGNRQISNNKAEGFYTTVGYKITPKLQAVARYDQYCPNKDFAKDIRREYSAGLNYFIKGQALKIMLNYVFCQNDIQKNSHRIILGTQILL